MVGFGRQRQRVVLLAETETHLLPAVVGGAPEGAAGQRHHAGVGDQVPGKGVGVRKSEPAHVGHHEVRPARRVADESGAGQHVEHLRALPRIVLGHGGGQLDQPVARGGAPLAARLDALEGAQIPLGARIIATLKRKSAADDAEQAVAQERQRTHEEMLRISRAVDAAGDAIAILNPEGRVTYVNEAYADFFGLGAPDLNVSERHRRLFEKPELWDEIWRTCEDGGAWSGEVEVRLAGERLAPTLCRADAIRDEQRAFLGVVLIFTDITQRKRLEEDLLYLANHDPLTGLHNRRFFLEVLQSAVGKAARGAHSFLLYLDLFFSPITIIGNAER